MQMPGNLIAALKMAPEREWDGMFDELVREKSLQIEGRSDLIDLKAEIKQLREIQNWFKQERNRK
jgi:hypothetical protein